MASFLTLVSGVTTVYGFRARIFHLMPPIIEKERKQVYYRYLELAQTEDRYDPLEQFIAETIITTGEEMEEAV